MIDLLMENPFTLIMHCKNDTKYRAWFKCCKFIQWNYAVSVNGSIKNGRSEKYFLMTEIFAQILHAWCEKAFILKVQSL